MCLQLLLVDLYHEVVISGALAGFAIQLLGNAVRRGLAFRAAQCSVAANEYQATFTRLLYESAASTNGTARRFVSRP